MVTPSESSFIMGKSYEILMHIGQHFDEPSLLFLIKMLFHKRLSNECCRIQVVPRLHASTIVFALIGCCAIKLLVHSDPFALIPVSN
jgi:hypothetical protein